MGWKCAKKEGKALDRWTHINVKVSKNNFIISAIKTKEEQNEKKKSTKTLKKEETIENIFIEAGVDSDNVNSVIETHVVDLDEMSEMTISQEESVDLIDVWAI